MNNFYGFKPYPYDDSKPVDLYLFRRFLHPINFSSKYDVCNIATNEFYYNNKFWFFLPDSISPQMFLWYLICDSKDSLVNKKDYEKVINEIKSKIVLLKGPQILIKDKNITNLERAISKVENIVFFENQNYNIEKLGSYELPHKFGFWMFDDLNVKKTTYITKDDFINPSHPFEEDPSFNINMKKFFDPKYSALFHDESSVLDTLGDLAMEFFWDILSIFKDRVDKQTYNNNLCLLNPEYFNITLKGVINLTSKILELSECQRAILARALIKYRLKYDKIKDRVDAFFL